MGVLALSNKHLMGMRWQQQSYQSRPHGSGAGAFEQFHTAEIWGRWQAARRLQVAGTIPLHLKERRLTNGLNTRTGGLGDIQLWGQYALIAPKERQGRNWRHALQLGIGLGLPTGNFSQKDTEGNTFVANMQPGTGSLNALFSGLYAVQYRQWGLLLEGAHQHALAHRADYWLGNRQMASVRIFWTKQWAKMQLVPHVGIQTEQSGRDFDGQRTVSESGGWVRLAALGLDAFVGRAIVSVQTQLPVASGLAQGYVTPQPRWQVGVALGLGRKKKQPITVPLPVPQADFLPNTHTQKHI